MDKQNDFDEWAILELMGHQRTAGRVSIAPLGGGSLIRVDVPGSEESQGFTKFYGTAAIYAITICDEQTARAAAQQFAPRPLDRFSVQGMFEQLQLASGDSPTAEYEETEYPW